MSEVSIGSLLFKNSRKSIARPSKVEQEFMALSKRRSVSSANSSKLRISTEVHLNYVPESITDVEELSENAVREPLFKREPDEIVHRRLSAAEAEAEIQAFKEGRLTAETDKGRFK